MVIIYACFPKFNYFKHFLLKYMYVKESRKSFYWQTMTLTKTTEIFLPSGAITPLGGRTKYCLFIICVCAVSVYQLMTDKFVVSDTQ